MLIQGRTKHYGVLCSSVCSMVGHWCAMVGWVWPMVGALCFYPLFWLAAGDCSNNNGTSHPLYLLLYVFVNNEKHNIYSWSPTIFCSVLHCYLNLHYYAQLILIPIHATFWNDLDCSCLLKLIKYWWYIYTVPVQCSNIYLERGDYSIFLSHFLKKSEIHL